MYYLLRTASTAEPVSTSTLKAASVAVLKGHVLIAKMLIIGSPGRKLGFKISTFLIEYFVSVTVPEVIHR